jgi:hypothetical protein
MEPEKAPWSSRQRRDRSRSPSAAAAASPRDPYDYIRRTRIKADEWDTYWDNFPTTAVEGGNNAAAAAAFNNNTVHKNNNNNVMAADGATTKNGSRPPDKAGAVTPPIGRPKETKELGGVAAITGGGSNKPSQAGMLAMEDESLEPEVKPIAARTEEAGRDLVGRSRTASKVSAKSSEFADLVAMKSHLPSAEFRLVSTKFKFKDYC